MRRSGRACDRAHVRPPPFKGTIMAPFKMLKRLLVYLIGNTPKAEQPVARKTSPADIVREAGKDAREVVQELGYAALKAYQAVTTPECWNVHHVYGFLSGNADVSETRVSHLAAYPRAQWLDALQEAVACGGRLPLSLRLALLWSFRPKRERYEPKEHIGEGAVSHAYVAEDRQAHKRVVMKVAPIDGSLHAAWQRCRELVSRAPQSRVLVTVLDIGEVRVSTPHCATGEMPVACEGAVESVGYRVEEWMQGGDLAARLADNRRVTLDCVRGWIGVVAEGAQTLASAGGHRSIGDFSILFPLSGRDDDPRLTDYGTAELLDGQPGALFAQHGAKQAVYLAPEQLRSEKGYVGPRADVWALGAIAFRCLVGESVCLASTLIEALERTEAGALEERVRSFESRLGPCAAVLRKALASDPAKRYAEPKEFALAFQTAA